MRAMLLALLLLLLLFQHHGQSLASALGGTRLLPVHTQQHQGLEATARSQEGWKGEHESAGGLEGYAGGDGGRMWQRRSAKGSSGGTGGGGGGGAGTGSGAKGGHPGGGETDLRQTPGRQRSGGSSVSQPIGPAQCAILMLLPPIFLL